MLAYIHIPFCESKCPYCAFNSYATKDHLKTSYMQALLSQLRYELERFEARHESIDSVFIGGGTPSTIAPSLFEPLFKVLSPYLKKGAEISSEANPHSATHEWLKGMQEIGVNRISFGVQSFNEAKLRFLGRNHTRKMAYHAIETAYRLGIENLSLDLIYGTAVDSYALLQNDLKIASSLPINHLSAYALTPEENTPFFNHPKCTNDSEKMAKDFVARIIDAGFFQYEISNFGHYQSLHNKGYWEQKEYMGIGSGAVGFLKNARFYPHKELEAYVASPLFYENEPLSASDLHVEKIFLGLRSVVGIDYKELTPNEREKVAHLLEKKSLRYEQERIYNNDYFLSDEIALYLMD